VKSGGRREGISSLKDESHLTIDLSLTRITERRDDSKLIKVGTGSRAANTNDSGVSLQHFKDRSLQESLHVGIRLQVSRSGGNGGSAGGGGSKIVSHLPVPVRNARRSSFAPHAIGGGHNGRVESRANGIRAERLDLSVECGSKGGRTGCEGGSRELCLGVRELERTLSRKARGRGGSSAEREVRKVRGRTGDFSDTGIGAKNVMSACCTRVIKLASAFTSAVATEVLVPLVTATSKDTMES